MAQYMMANKEEALRRLEIQANLAVDAMCTVMAFPWVYTNAGVLAEASAHWAFTAHPELRDAEGRLEEVLS